MSAPSLSASIAHLAADPVLAGHSVVAGETLWLHVICDEIVTCHTRVPAVKSRLSTLARACTTTSRPT